MSWSVLEGDCIEAMRAMDEASVDAVVCDPPYGLGFMGKDWDTAAAMHLPPSAEALDTPLARMRTGKGPAAVAFDARAFQAWCEAWAVEALRVLKPGGHLLAFGGTRTYHRLACAIEDAGFEVRDCIAWLYGSGFPKSLDVSKAIDAQAGAVREVVGRYESPEGTTGPRSAGGRLPGVALGEPGSGLGLITAPATPDAERWQGWGTALKPAHEPIVVARKPLTGTVAATVLATGCGALNIDACRVGVGEGGTRDGEESADRRYTDNGSTNFAPTPGPRGGDALGRWPANVVLDVCWTPVLRLRDNLSDDADELLREWVCARSRAVPAVRSGRRRPAEPSEAEEVLRSGVLVGVAERAQPGRSAPDARAAALAGVDSQDERVVEGDRANGRALADVEGRPVPVEGLLDGVAVDRVGRGHGARIADGAEGPGLPARASAGHGANAGTPVEEGRGRPPSQRREDGQPAGEPRDARHADASDDARGAVSRATRAAGAGREVLLRDVPAHWLRFFEFTGDVADVGSAAMLDEQTGELAPGVVPGVRSPDVDRSAYGAFAGHFNGGTWERLDGGGASRFFYCAKASSAERNAGLDGFEATGAHDGGRVDGQGGMGTWDRKRQNSHPTVKPIDLMRWLVRLVTPPAGLVLDPFTGSGTTGCAAVLEGFRFLGIEREDEYAAIARARLAWWAKRGQVSTEAALRAGLGEDVIAASGQSAFDLLGGAA